MMEGSVQPPSRNGCKEGAVRKIKKERGAPSGKSVVVLKSSDVTKQNGIVFMPNTIEMAQLKKPEKGQFKTNVQFSSRMTELEVSQTLMDTFPCLKDQRLYCAAAVDNRTRLDFHGEPRVWDGKFLRRKIKGNSALYILTDKGEIAGQALQIAQTSSSSDTGFCDQEMVISSNACCETAERDNSYVPNVAPEDMALCEDFSETAEPDNSSVPSIAPEHMALFEVVHDINPKSGSLEGGYEFYIFLTQPSDIRSGIAQFKGVNSVALQKVNPYTFSGTVPSSGRAGDVEVTVLDQTGNRLGMTTFRYVDHEREMLKQLVNNKEKQCLFFSKWAQECALGKFGNYNTAQGGDLVTLQDQGQTKQQQSLQLLQLLVYTAAETNAQEFIKMIFSTSAGPTIFYSYKDKTPLPEDVARANGHRYLAQYLQDVNTRLSKEVGSEAQSNAIDWLELVKAVQTQASAVQVKSVKEEKHPSESDDNSSDYFADSETSSNGSLGLDEANQPDSDSDSSIDKELCNITGWYNEEPSKSPATRARQEGPSCKTPEVEKPPNREDSGATLLDNKDRTPFEKEKPAADSMEEKDYAVGRGFINSLSQWFSTTRKKRKDETKSATIRRFNGATFFWGPFDKGDTSGQANVHSAENPQECAGKGHLSSQRRTAPDFKYSRITVTCVVLVVLVVLLVLAGIMQGIEFTVHHLIAIVYGVTTGLLTEVTMGDCVLVFKCAVVALLFVELINTVKKKMNEKDCNIAGLCHEEPNQRPATCACKEGPCCETPGVEKPPNREDSGATRLDNKDRTAFEKEKPAADSKEEKDYAVGWGFIDSRPQLLSYTREKREDEKCADKDHMSSQRRTGPDLKYILVVIICLVDAVLVGNMLIVCDVGLVFSESDFSLLKVPPADPQNCALADRPRLEVLPVAGTDNLRNERVELGFPKNCSGYMMSDAGKFVIPDMFHYHVKISKVKRFAAFCDHSNDNSSVTTQNINAEVPAAFKNCNTGESFVSESHSVKQNQGQDNSVTLLLFSRRFDGHFSAIIMVNQKLDECTNNIVHSTLCTVGELLVNLTFPLGHLLENQMLDELVAVDLSRGTRDVLKRAIKQFYQRNTIDALNFRFPAIFYYGSGEKPRYSNMFGSVCQTCQFDGDPVDDPYELLLLKYSEFWDLVGDRGRPPRNNCYNHYQRIFSNSFQRLFLFLLVMFVTIFIAICCVVRLIGFFATPIYCLHHLCGKPCKEDLQANELSYGYEDLEIGHQMKDTTCRGSICGLSAQGKSLRTGINIFHQCTTFVHVYHQFVENASKEELQMERLRYRLVHHLPVDLNSGVEERLSQLAPSLSRVLTFDGGSRTKTIFYDHAHTELSPYNNFITCLRLLLTLALSTDDDKKGKASIPRELGLIEKQLESLACLIDICGEEVPIDYYERVVRRYGFSIRSRNSKPLGKTGKQRQDREIMKELVKLWKTLVRALERLEVETQVMREEVDHEAVVKSFNLFLLWKWKNAALEEGLHSSVNSSIIQY